MPHNKNLSDFFYLQEFELRKHARQEGRRYCDPVVLTYQAERMPEQIRLKVRIGGIVSPYPSLFSFCLCSLNSSPGLRQWGYMLFLRQYPTLSSVSLVGYLWRRHKDILDGVTGLVQLVENTILDLRVMSSSPTWGVEIT